MIIAALLILLLIYAKELLVPFTIAIFFTFLLLPISNWLHQHKVPHALAIIISIIIAIIVFGGLIYFFYSQVQSFVDDWPALKEQLNKKMNSIHSFIAEKFNISKSEQTNWLKKKAEETAEGGDEVVVTVFAITGTFLANFALIPIYIFFLTYFKDKYKQFVLMVSPPEEHKKVIEIIREITGVSQKYLKGIMIDVAILSVLNSAGFLLLGIEHAILFGVLASLLNIIPYVGVLIGSLLPIAMALLTKDSMAYALGAAGVCMVVQFIDNNIINPYVVGSSVSINPLTATLALVGGALIWGIAGMVLCMPVFGMIKVVCDRIPKLKPYGFLIGEERHYDHEDHYSERLLKRFRRKKVA